MTDKVIRIAIDSGPAEQGADRVIRSLEGIRAKSVGTADGIRQIESDLRKLQEQSRTATTTLCELAEKSGRLGPGFAQELSEGAGETKSILQRLKATLEESVTAAASLQSVLEFANSFEHLRQSIPALTRALKALRFFTGVSGVAVLALEIAILVDNIKQLDGTDREFEAIMERINKILKDQGNVTAEEIRDVQGAISRKIQNDREALEAARENLADIFSELETKSKAFHPPARGDLIIGNSLFPMIEKEERFIGDTESKIRKLTELLGLLDQKLDELTTQRQELDKSFLVPGTALTAPPSPLTDLQTRFDGSIQTEVGRQTAAAQELSEIQAGLERYSGELRNLNELLAAGTINQGQFGEAATVATQRLTEAQEESLSSSRELSDGARRAFLDYADAATNAAAQAEDLVTKGLQGMEEALASFVQTGELDFKSLIDSMVADLIRLQIRAAVLGPLSNFLGGLFSGAGVPGQVSTSQAQILNSTGDIALRTSLPGGIGGAAHGGSFLVPGSGAPDSRLLIERVTPGELVTFTPPGRGAGGVVNNIQVINEAGAAVETTERPNASGGLDTVIRLLKRDVERDILEGGAINRAIASGFGLRNTAAAR